jgi:hypothetical protein
VYSTVIRVADGSDVSALLHAGALAVASNEQVLYCTVYTVHTVYNRTQYLFFNASITHRRFVVAMITGFLFFPTFSKRIEKDAFIVHSTVSGQNLKTKKRRTNVFASRQKTICFIFLNEKYAFLFPFLIQTVT